MRTPVLTDISGMFQVIYWNVFTLAVCAARHHGATGEIFFLTQRPVHEYEAALGV